MTEQTGLRERKKLQTRRRIEGAALELFGRDGFDGTTVEGIAAAADIAPRTFFYYFPTKEDVVLADYAGRLERIVDQLRQRPDSERPWAALRASFLVVAADYDADHREIIRRFQIMATSPSVYARSLQLQAGWEDTVAAVLTERMGCQTEELGPRLLASCALSAIRSSLRHWIVTGQQSSLPQLVEGCFDQLGEGLGAVS
jgi:AcrR family transcriptional regulator